MAITQTLSFGNVTLKVTPESLLTTSDAVSKRINSMSKYFDHIYSVVNQSESYWVGDAGDLHRKLFQDMKPGADEIFLRLKEHVRELQEMARVYTDTEKSITAALEELPTDVII
jgi:WXG100 family type VII secretion target